MELFSDGFRISIKDRQKPVHFSTDSSLLWFSNISMLKSLAENFGKGNWDKSIVLEAIKLGEIEIKDQIKECEDNLKELKAKAK